MKHLLLVLFLATCLGCEEEIPLATYPKLPPVVFKNTKPQQCIDGKCPTDRNLNNKRGAYMLNPKLRHANWGPSCVYASLTNVLETSQLTDKVNHVRSKYYGPANPINLVHASEAIGVAYAQGHNAEGRAILEFCDRTGRCAVIFFKASHACTYMGVVRQGQHQGKIMVLDPNHPDRPEYWSSNEFYAEWGRRGAFSHVVLEQPIPGNNI